MCEKFGNVYLSELKRWIYAQLAFCFFLFLFSQQQSQPIICLLRHNIFIYGWEVVIRFQPFFDCYASPDVSFDLLRELSIDKINVQV